MVNEPVAIKAPTWQPLRELWGLARDAGSLVGLLKKWPNLPRGRGPVMVIPGLGTNDSSTLLLREFLSSLGYEVRGWERGLNFGKVEADVEALERDIIAWSAASQSGVILIGWSLGGTISRELARRHPSIIRGAISMGTPVIGGPKYTAFVKLYTLVGVDVERIAERLDAENTRPIKTRTASLYSAQDSVVAWEASLDPNGESKTEHIEVSATHWSYGSSLEVFEVLAGLLSEWSDAAEYH